MRHGKTNNHLGRKAEHRRAMLANMANSLIEHKRITTTLAKAKALRNREANMGGLLLGENKKGVRTG